MKTYIRLLFFLINASFLKSQAQPPLLKSLTSDTKRLRTDEKPNDSYKNKNARLESVIDTVKTGLTIKITAGYNPRCVNDNSSITFEATAVNGGSNPLFEWSVNGNPVGTNSVQFTLISPQNGTIIACRMTSSSNCVSNKIVTSNIITIKNEAVLQSSVSIQVASGDNPACLAKTKILFYAIPTNGGNNPSFEWYFNNSLAGTGITFSRDSMANANFVYCIMQSNLACADAKDTSTRIIRSVVRNIASSVDLALINITNDDCTQKQYNFKAVPINAGQNAIYNWYKNNVFVLSTVGSNFSTPLPNNGDDVYVQLNSSLFCANPNNPISKKFIRTDTINLPFFDDFSTTYAGKPDKDLWVKNGGTYINNNLCETPPTYNVASFDGLSYTGAAYDTLISTSRGGTDQLISLPINLATFSNSDLIKIVFYWQPQGMGEIPDSTQGDRLTLSFKNSLGAWNQVWVAKGQSKKPFKQEILTITKDNINDYLHNGFQFRFQSFGRLSGMYDVWNVDYVYVNIITTTSISFPDQSFGPTPKSILKMYASMPLSHFKINPARELTDTLSVYANNMYDRFNGVSFVANFYDNKTNTYLQNFYTTGANFVDAFVTNFKVTRPVSINPIPTNATAPYELRTQFELVGDKDNADGLGINYTRNNTISGITILDNYFAYDDGTAEYGIGLNQKFGQMAYKFYLSKPDTLRQIAVNIIKMGVISLGQTINICVWKKLPVSPTNTKTPELLFKKNYVIKYPNNVDEFVVFDLDKTVALTDSFYVGYQQISDDMITLGWDKNNNSNQHIFYATSGKWTNYTDEKGSIMIRPVFGIYNYLTDNKELEQKFENKIALFPNPSNGRVCSNVLVTSAQIYNLSGQLVWQISALNDYCFDYGMLPKGLYIVQLYAEGKTTYIKMLVGI